MIEPAAPEPKVEAAAEATISLDPSVSTAFAVGWGIASLHHDASLDNERRADESDGLPGISVLSALEHTELAVDLIEANLHKLGGLLAAAPVDDAPIKELRRALTPNPGDLGAFRHTVQELHVEALFSLTAADSRLGKAYVLGQALADTCMGPEDRPSLDRAFGSRLVNVRDWLADLASHLPPHSSRAVVLSLRTWEAWAADPVLDGESLDWETHGAGVQAALRRQGELWRDLLSGEKRGEDMLDTDHYLRAASSLATMMTSTVWRFLRPLRLPLAVMTLLLGGGIALLLLTGSVGQVFGAIAVIAGSLGITGAGIRARLGKVAAQLQARLWGAELDLAIAEAILIGPTGWGARVTESVPASGMAPKVMANLETLREFRQGVSEEQGGKIRDLLASDAEFIVGTEAKRGRDDVTEWILKAPASTRKRIATKPQRVVAGGPGVLVTYVDSGADIWRVQEGKVRRWQRGQDPSYGGKVGAGPRTG